MLVGSLWSCSNPESNPATAAGDGKGDDGTTRGGPQSPDPTTSNPTTIADADSTDSGHGGSTTAPGSTGSSTGDPGPFDPGPVPTEPLRPVPGELSLHQLQLDASGFFLAEAGVIIGPDGTLALLDVGNSIHDDPVREVVRRLNTEDLTPARGYPRQRGELEVDWIIITHWHADHTGGYDNLVHGSDPVTVTKGVVHRGFTDLGSGVTENDYEEVCNSLRGPLVALDFPACTPDVQAPCDVAAASEPHRATRCDGLFLGDLEDPSDDRSGAPSSIALGDGATITFIAAAGHASDGQSALPGPVFGHDDNGFENARSLAGTIAHGSFRYHFGGDLTGRDTPDDPDVETHVAMVAAPVFYGPLGVDVTHVHHHARATSSNETFVDAVAPNDGRSRNAVAGINGGHIGSPQAQTLAEWLDANRLGEGRLWATETTITAADHEHFIAADGPVIVQTVQGGRGYWAQAAGDSLLSLAYQSVRD